ncbi:glycoside hydrolase family 3 N-terminal domain-containing protein [Adhaeribacter radiodurans]|uniref:beta-N-acetylhexosaminidase n=1 Tax=Adhaeribacter radiodurans TaxID=2745197 RepID=A0A7L7L909_9BACT|nr:glycoside hydrolase family 3 N-terminal domain-containing protein [Adhaeribacter radiodurans]QMU29310.1 serine hydrolase [Adhaeribacter radiodurans]
MKHILTIIFFLYSILASGQQFLQTSPAAQRWVDSTFKHLSKNEKIAQLMVVRLSERKGTEVAFYDKEVAEDLKKYNIGSVCLFQGKSTQHAAILNKLQSQARTPLLVTVDGETGLGMRFSDVTPFPNQLTLGAISDASLAYKLGSAIGEQCKRMGIQVDYAPVVDINNNPDNPVINFRSLGEDKYKVALFAGQIMKGMQDKGVMACLKHFPGHGDVAVDSHLDLPVINKTMPQLEELELYPFRQLIQQGVGSVMVAHLYIPTIDTIRNQATSLSRINVSGLLRSELGFKGLTFTDALEMKGVTKFYPQGEASVQSLIAGNDMLCLPGDVETSIKAIRKARREHRLTWAEIDEKVKKVLLAKYNLGLNKKIIIDTTRLAAGLNSQVTILKREIYQQAITLVRQTDPSVLPLTPGKKVAYVGIGITEPNHFAKQLQQTYGAECFYLGYKSDTTQARAILNSLRGKQYDAIILGLHQYQRYPANNFGISAGALQLLQQIQQIPNTLSLAFGNPYALKNFAGARNLIAAYEDDEVMQEVAVNVLKGITPTQGKLPVTVSPEYVYGSGIKTDFNLPTVAPELVGLDSNKLNQIDSLANNAIAKGAVPGCVILVAKNGKIAFHRAYGHLEYNKKEPITLETVYDLASVTKISATTMAVMKLFEEGKLDLQKTLGDYLPEVKGSDKAPLTIKDILLHQAGLIAFITFYKETMDEATGKPKPGIYSSVANSRYPFRVGEDMYLRRDWADTLSKRIIQSKLGPANTYVYSDNDFIYLGKVVAQISGLPLDEYVRSTFYLPLGMRTTTFKPREHLPLNSIAPTEYEPFFRNQLVRGDVHDPGAALFGGVAGHAGLFSNAYDLAKLYQLLLNGGELNGVRLFKKETIYFFTAYHSNISRRGLGFDKPEKDNATRKTPYPTLSASEATFGHTGFTGTCVWADPKSDLLFIFLSNRVNPRVNNKLMEMNVRGSIQEVVYQSIIKPTAKILNTTNKLANSQLKTSKVKKPRSRS